MFSLASQRLEMTAIPEGYVSAVHLLRNRKLGREDFLCKVRSETVTALEAGPLGRRPTADNDIQVALEGKPGFIEQRNIGKKAGLIT